MYDSVIQSPPHKHNYYINTEEWSDWKSPKPRRAETPSSPSVYLTPRGISSFNVRILWTRHNYLFKWAITVTIKVPAHVWNCIDCQLCSYGGVQKCTYVSSAAQIGFPYMYYTSAHFWLFAPPSHVHTLSVSVPISERCARHVCSVALNNSLDVGTAALLWRNILSSSAMWQYLHVQQRSQFCLT